MKKYYWIFKNMPLFKNIPKDKYDAILYYLKVHIKEYGRGEVIIGLSNTIENVGIVLSGKIYMILYSQYGSEHNVQYFEQGSLFGETLAYTLEENNALEIIASEKSKILFLDFSNFYKGKPGAFPYSSQITLNLLNEALRKNSLLNKKIEILSQKKIRDKIGIYLKMLQANDSKICIPLNRQEMADFLGVDRSALSRELCIMREEGIIEFNKNEFIILESKW